MSSTSIGQVAEIAPLAVFLRVPVEGELQEGRALGGGAALVVGRRQEDERIPARLALHAANLLHAELAAIEVQALLDVRDAHHGMQIPQRHVATSC